MASLTEQHIVPESRNQNQVRTAPREPTTKNALPICAERPTVAKDDGLSSAPVLVIDLRPVIRRKLAHFSSPTSIFYCRLESSTSYVRPTIRFTTA